MAKSIAQKKSAKKLKGTGSGRKGKRHDYARSRSVVTAWPQDTPHTGMLVRNQVVTLDRIESSGWAKMPDLNAPVETNTLTAVMSDGRTFEKNATIRYKRGQREQIIEAITSGGEGKETEKAIRNIQAIRRKRESLLMNAYATLQRLYGKGFVAPVR